MLLFFGVIAIDYEIVYYHAEMRLLCALQIVLHALCVYVYVDHCCSSFLPGIWNESFVLLLRILVQFWKVLECRLCRTS